MHAFLKTGKLDHNAPGTSSQKEKSDTVKSSKGPKPWVEKYRPRSIDDVIYQDEVVAVLKKTLEGADIPNMLFYGPPGTGKTSTILASARQMFGDLYSQRVMELNASDERGIQVIREKVKSFAQTAVSSSKSNGQQCPPLKIIILDEADSMTAAAQAALRRTMEKQSKTTRFCLLCNYVSRIIDPLTSRCSKFRFKALSHEVLLKHLANICEREGVDYGEGVLQALIETSEGDLRRAITSLQSIAKLKLGSQVTEEDVFEITGVIPNKWISELFEVSSSGSYDRLSEFIDQLIMEGYSASQLLAQVHKRILDHDELSEEQKDNILERLAVCDYRLCDGADEYLQIMDFCSFIMQQVCHPNIKCSLKY